MLDKKQNPGLNTIPIDAELKEIEVEPAQEGTAVVEDFVLRVGTRRDERVLAFCALYAVDRSDYTATLNEAIEDFKKNYNFSVTKASFAVKLAKGAIDNRVELEEKIKPYLKNWKMERLGCCTRLILRMALWELQRRGAIPSVIINEAVEIAKMFAEQDAYRFVNGILDEYCKHKKLENSTEKTTKKKKK